MSPILGHPLRRDRAGGTLRGRHQRVSLAGGFVISPRWGGRQQLIQEPIGICTREAGCFRCSQKKGSSASNLPVVRPGTSQRLPSEPYLAACMQRAELQRGGCPPCPLAGLAVDFTRGCRVPHSGPLEREGALEDSGVQGGSRKNIEQKNCLICYCFTLLLLMNLYLLCVGLDGPCPAQQSLLLEAHMG